MRFVVFLSKWAFNFYLLHHKPNSIQMLEIEATEEVLAAGISKHVDYSGKLGLLVRQFNENQTPFKIVAV